MKNSMAEPQNFDVELPVEFTSGYILKRIGSRDSNRYLYTDIYSSIIYNSQILETTQMSIDKWMDKQNVVYLCVMEYYLPFKRKEILTHAVAWMNLEDIPINEMSVTKGQIPYDSPYVKYLE